MVDDHALRLFQREVEWQASFALLAASDLEEAVRCGDLRRAWYSVQAFLVAAASVSMLLWPGPRADAERGRRLRSSLDVEEDCALKDRRLRDHLVHFDERLDAWAGSSERRCFIDSNIGPASMIRGADSADSLRHYDPTSGVLTFRGESYELSLMIDALAALRRKAQAFQGL